MKRWQYFLVAFGLILSATTQSQNVWQPTVIDWTCNLVGSERRCSVVAEGPPPPGGLLAPYRLTGWYRILKGSTLGQGQVLMTQEVSLPCTVTPTGLRCAASDIVILGSGIAIVPDPAPTPMSLNIYAASGVTSVLFDWDGDGEITAGRESIAVLRFLLGFRGATVTSGIPLKVGLTPGIVNEQIALGIWNGWFQFGSSQTPIATQQGIMLIRCLLGLRGTTLVDGISGATASVADSQCNLLLERR